MQILPKASTAAIKQTLDNHNAKLDSIIIAINKYDPMAFTSLQDMIDKFTETKENLSAKIGELTKQIAHSTDTAAIAMANPVSMSIGVKLVGGPIAQLIAELKSAWDIVNLVIQIVTKYIKIFALVAARIIEMALMIVALGLKFVKNALANLLAELYAFISEMKKKAVQYAKDKIRTTLVTTWEKDRGTLQERLTLLEKTPTQDNLAERNTIKVKIKSLTASIVWVTNTLKPAEVSI
ncbi:MAG: hypothetical protein JHC33_08720 [Ignisphaera sp.]|nr:hypothetical protein [Ignisphaera sp.]